MYEKLKKGQQERKAKAKAERWAGYPTLEKPAPLDKLEHTGDLEKRLHDAGLPLAKIEASLQPLRKLQAEIASMSTRLDKLLAQSATAGGTLRKADSPGVVLGDRKPGTPGPRIDVYNPDKRPAPAYTSQVGANGDLSHLSDAELDAIIKNGLDSLPATVKPGDCARLADTRLARHEQFKRSLREAAKE